MIPLLIHYYNPRYEHPLAANEPVHYSDSHLILLPCGPAQGFVFHYLLVIPGIYIGKALGDLVINTRVQVHGVMP